MTTRRAVLSAGLATAGCAVAPRLPGESILYSYGRDADPASSRPIVTIPGLLGSRLKVASTGAFVWGGPTRISGDPVNEGFARDLALPIGDGDRPLTEFTDGIDPAGIMRRASALVLGVTVEQSVDEGLVGALNAGGYQFSRSEQEEFERRGRNPGSLEFPYDWRRDIVESARALDAFIERKAHQVAEARKELYGVDVDPATLRFDFVAHSMGTLVLRYWLMYGGRDLPADGSLPERDWAGARRAACVIMLTPPNLGSVSALRTIVNGHRIGPLQPDYPPALLATHMGTYQLMSRDRHKRVMAAPGRPLEDDIYSVDTWARLGWGLLDPNQDDVLRTLLPDIADRSARHDRAGRFLAQMLRRAEQFHRAMDRPGTPPDVDMFLVVGTGLDTPASAVIGPRTGRLLEASAEEGYGVVLRASALSDERQGGHMPENRVLHPIAYRTVLLLPSEHVDITRNAVFADNMLYWLRDQPRVRQG